MGCDNLDNMNAQKGVFCDKGEDRGFAFSATALTVDNDSLKSKNWWDAAYYAATGRVIAMVGANDSEKVPGEVSVHKPKWGGSVRGSKSSNEHTIKFLKTDCIAKSLYALDGVSGYVVFITELNWINALPNGATQSDFVLANILISEEIIDGKPYINANFTFPEIDFEQLEGYLQMDAGFKASDILGLTSVYFEAVSCDLTSDFIFDVYDCNRVGIESGLTTGNVIAYNLTDDPGRATPIVPSAVTGVGNRWTATIAAQDSTDIIEILLVAPSATNLYVTGEPDTVEASA